MSHAGTTACSALHGDLLSAYLDDELQSTEAAAVEEHIQDCNHCRLQLDSLARVANSLRGLERVAPPPVLDEMVLGRLEIGAARSWTQRLDHLLGPSQRTRSTIGPVFALVMMLVMLVFFFTEAQVRRAGQSVVISLPSGVGPDAPDFLMAPVEGDVIVDGVGGYALQRVWSEAEPEVGVHWISLAERYDFREVWIADTLDDESVGPAAVKCLAAGNERAERLRAGLASAVAGRIAVVLPGSALDQAQSVDGVESRDSSTPVCLLVEGQ